MEPPADPIAALEQQGHTFSAGVKSRLKAGLKPTPAQQRIWQQAAAKAGKSLVTVGQNPTIIARELSPNEFEFSAGVRMPVANEILAGMHANGTIPNELFLDELLFTGDSDTLQSLFVMDRPGGCVGRLQITGPPAIAQISEGSDRVGNKVVETTRENRETEEIRTSVSGEQRCLRRARTFTSASRERMAHHLIHGNSEQASLRTSSSRVSERQRTR